MGGKSNEVVFRGEKYKSQAQFRKYVKDLIYNTIGLCQDVMNEHPKEHKILIELLKRHPKFDERSENMCNLKIVHPIISVDDNKPGFEINIIKNNGDEVSISWRKAVTGKSESQDQLLKAAMRTAVEPDIQVFRIEHSYEPCQMCHIRGKLQVDHEKEFIKLIADFLKENIEIPDKFGKLEDGSNRTTFLEKDTNFKNRWIKYHKENASLRMLCGDCNNSRQKTNIRFINN
jgi:hypothetical protein